jgi:hypothetical protein
MKTVARSTSSKKSTKAKEIKTDLPLSEKDEVKQAENRLRESQKKKRL